MWFLFVLLLMAYFGYAEPDLSCHQISLKSEIKNIQDDIPPQSPSIFFLETSCKSYEVKDKIHLSARQACAVESAALKNPNHTVYVLFAAPIDSNANSTTTDLLLSYKNVRFRRILKENFAQKSPVEDVIRSQLNSSDFPVYHMSDILRVVVLWRYPGVYMDLDVISLKSLKYLPSGNWIGALHSHLLGASVLSLVSTAGRKISEEILVEVARTYTPNKWFYNGMGALERVLSQGRCNFTKPPFYPAVCKGIRILHPRMVYPVTEDRALWLINGRTRHLKREDLNNIDSSRGIQLRKAILLHTWETKLSRCSEFPPRLPSAPLVRIARKHCPTVYKQHKKNFLDCSSYLHFQPKNNLGHLSKAILF